MACFWSVVIMITSAVILPLPAIISSQPGKKSKSTKIGGAVVAAISIGEKDIENANKTFFHSFMLTALIAVIVMLAGTLLTDPLSAFLGADAAHKELTKEYLFWWSLFALPALLSVNLQGFCRNDGAPTYVAVATISSTVLNIFLDWLFVFPSPIIDSTPPAAPPHRRSL